MAAGLQAQLAALTGGGSIVSPVQDAMQPPAKTGVTQATAGHDHMGMASTGGTPSTASGSSLALLGPSIVKWTDVVGADVNRRADGSVGKTTYARPVPEDRTKAAAVVQRLVDSTAKFRDPAAAQAAGYDFTKHALEGDILHVSKAGNGLDLDDPKMLLYRKTGNSYDLIGVVLTANAQAPDLGMGTWHAHFGNDDLMKHVFLRPGNLDQAFSETPPPK